MAAFPMELEQFRPVPTLVTSSTHVAHPKFPVIDAHNHLGEEFGGGWINRPLLELLDRLDEARVDVLVDLDGGWGEDILYSHLDRVKNPAPDRFQVFGGVDWSSWLEHGDRFGEWAAERLRAQARRGAQGLKIWKQLGLRVCDHHGRLVRVDDERLDPLWAAAGELRLPVLVHVADPVAFFQPLDERNERWEELQAHPDWHFPASSFPPFLDIVEAFARVVARHPNTNFIGAHVGCYAENLSWVSALLDRCSNFYVDISARLGELGRQPYTTRRFFLDYPDRILYGLDVGPDLVSYQIQNRFLETEDEYFDYGPGLVPGQGRWRIYGLGLPDDVLERVYHRNARRVLNGLED